MKAENILCPLKINQLSESRKTPLRRKNLALENVGYEKRELMGLILRQEAYTPMITKGLVKNPFHSQNYS